MRVVIAGPRIVNSYYQVYKAIEESGFVIDTIISGTAVGVDTTGEEFGSEHNIPVERYPADWKTHGKKAGFMRNSKMADESDASIVIWDKSAKGSKNMIDTTKSRGNKLHVHIIQSAQEVWESLA